MHRRVAVFVVLVAAALANTVTPLDDEKYLSALSVDPASLHMLSEDSNVPESEIARQFILDVGVPAVSVLDDQSMNVMDSFMTDALQESPATYKALGSKWLKFKKLVKQVETKAKKLDSQANKALSGPFDKQKHHGLNKLEYRYMRMYQRYNKLHQAYKRGCGVSRFWLKMNKWHWKVLTAASRKLRELVKLYKHTRSAYRSLPRRLNAKFAWMNSKSPYKSIQFFKQIIAYSQAGIKGSQEKAAAAEAEKQQIKSKAEDVAKKMETLMLDEHVQDLAHTMAFLQEVMSS